MRDKPQLKVREKTTIRKYYEGKSDPYETSVINHPERPAPEGIVALLHVTTFQATTDDYRETD